MRELHLWSQALLDNARPIDVGDGGDPDDDVFGCHPPGRRSGLELPYLCAPELAPSRSSSPGAGDALGWPTPRRRRSYSDPLDGSGRFDASRLSAVHPLGAAYPGASPSVSPRAAPRPPRPRRLTPLTITDVPIDL